MLSENIKKSIVNKYFDAMLRTTVCDYTKYARSRGCNPITVKSWITQGLRRIAEAAGAIEGLSVENVLCGFEGMVEGGGFRDELDRYIGSHEPVYWGFLPHAGELPSAEELIGFLLENYRGEIARSIIDGYWNTVKGTDVVLRSLQSSVDACYKTEWHKYQRYQVRFYDYSDRLVGKYTYPDERSAVEYAEKKLGNTPDRYSRYIIRTNSLFSGEWYICRSGGNASVTHIYRKTPEKWRVAYYDYEDCMIKKTDSKTPAKEAERTAERNRLNAMYYVLSCREPGAPDFKVQYFAVSGSCRIDGIAEVIQKKVIEYNSRHSDRLYRKMLEKDAEETQRMLAQGLDPENYQEFTV